MHLISIFIYQNTSFTFYCTHLGIPLEIFLWAEVKVFQILSMISRPRHVHIWLMHCSCHLYIHWFFTFPEKFTALYIHSCVYHVFLLFLAPEIWEILLSFLCQGILWALFILKGGTKALFSTSVLWILASFTPLKLLSPTIHRVMNSGCLGYCTLHTQEKNCPLQV